MTPRIMRLVRFDTTGALDAFYAPLKKGMLVNKAETKHENILLRSLPQVEEVLKHPLVAKLKKSIPHDALTQYVRQIIETLRQQILNGERPDVSLDDIAGQTANKARCLINPSLRRVINATGVIIHTNLGRSPLAPEAVAAVNAVMSGYSTLEYNTTRMERGSRHDHYESLICALTGAEAALAVNNNAAAVLLVLNEFARGRQVIVSRGELVEIGGSFRIPDIMEQSGAQMVEVGTTNKTHPADYERALSSEVALVLKVHPSNYRLVGFTNQVDIADLRCIVDRENATRTTGEPPTGEPPTGEPPALVYEDQGSGALDGLEVLKSAHEPIVTESLRAGADLVSFSGDKLLGGPQAGIIVGRRELIERLKRNPLVRALRLDKMTLAALEATLRLYLQPKSAQTQIPTLRMLTEDASTTRARAERLQDALALRVPHDYAQSQVEPEIACAGGGALPLYDIDTFVVALDFAHEDSAQKMHEFLIHNCDIPIITRIKDNKLLFDARTILNDEEIGIIADSIGRFFTR